MRDNQKLLNLGPPRLEDLFFFPKQMKMKQSILFILCAFCYFTSTAQDGHCGVEHPILLGEGEVETDNGNNPCFGCETFTMKTLKLKIHVIRNEFGENNFSPEEEHLLELIINTANEKLGANSYPSHPAVPNQYVPPINLQFEIAEVAYYDYIEWAYPPAPVYPPLDPDLLDIVMLEQKGEWYGTGCNDPDYCAASHCCSGGWTHQSSPNNRAIISRAYYRYQNETILQDCVDSSNGDHEEAWAKHYADILIHEVGHMLTLDHNFDFDDCADTPEVEECDSNNFMDGCPCNKSSFTCCQITKMHNKLEAGNYAFMVEEAANCESDFLIVPYTDCKFVLINNSTTTGGSIVNTNWCIEDLQELGENAFEYHNTYNVLFDPSCNGAYQVCLEIENSDGCISVTCQDLSVDCTPCTCEPGRDPCEDQPGDRSLEAPAPSLHWHVFPNPANTYLNIHLHGGLNGDVTIELFNMLGQLIKSTHQKTSEAAIVWDVSDIEGGAYLIRAKLPNGEYAVKEIIITR